MEEYLQKTLQINVNIKAAQKIGTKTCLIELNNQCEKFKIMVNKNKLRNYIAERVFINEDMTKVESIIQGKPRKNGKEEGKKVKLDYQKLSIDGQKCTWCKKTSLSV